MKYNPFPELPVEIATCYRLFTPRRLKKTDLRSLDWERLADWMQEARIYVGGEDEFRELLPRFFELAWKDASARNILDLSPLRSITVLPTWPAHEREAVEACLMLLWRLALSNEDSWGVDEMLWTLQNAEINLTPFLDSWLGSTTSTSVLTETFSVTQWERVPQYARLWLAQPAVAARIQADFFAAKDDEERTQISEFEQAIAFYCTNA